MREKPGHTRIEKARLDKGWSQARLAREAHVSENTVLNHEAAKTRTQPAKLAAMEQALGLASHGDEMSLSGVPEDVRWFLHHAALRLTAMNDDARSRLLAELYPWLIERTPEAAGIEVGEALSRRRRGQESPRATG